MATVASLATQLLPVQAGAPVARTEKVVLIKGTSEVAPTYIEVFAQLGRDGLIVTGEPSGLGGLALDNLDLDDLDGLLAMLSGERAVGDNGEVSRDRWFGAFLDTGASSIVISLSTAQRFNIDSEPNAIYHETGLHGQIPMAVSRPYDLAVCGTSGLMAAKPGKFVRVLGEGRFQLNREEPNAMTMLMGEVNVIGMPVIRKLVVEIDPAPMVKTLNMLQGLGADINNIDQLLNDLEGLGKGPMVRLHPPGTNPPSFDLEIPLKYVNFSRRHNPIDRGPLPEMANNPVIESVQTIHGGETFTANWFLDTGAPISIISHRHARALGILDADGRPKQPAQFTMPLGGVGGGVTQLSGYRIDRLRLKDARGQVVEYSNVHALIHDVSTKLDDGKTVTLDGLFGTNLLLPSISMGSMMPGGLPGLGAVVDGDAPYKKIWIDGPTARLLLELP